jgi:hypothetical protein
VKVILQTEFHCDTCNKVIVGLLGSNTDDELTQHEKDRGLEHLKHNHQTDARLSCWKCKGQFETHDIEGLIWTSDSWQDLCKQCLLEG